jgi:hypothetical protein
MNLKRALLIGLFVLGAAHTAAAQQQTIDVKRLPVDLNKVTRQLRQSSATASRDGLHIRYSVDVYGQAPRIELFTKEDKLTGAPAPYGAPSHREMIEHVTPIEYRAPYADIGSLMRWLSERTKK